MGTITERGIKLTDDEIKFCDMLSERWEKEVGKANHYVLLRLYESEKAVNEKFKTFELIPVGILRDDLIGEGKKFKTLWELFKFVAETIRLVFHRPEARFVMPTGTIIIIHRPGDEKSIIISSITKEGKRWTYKEYRYKNVFEQEIKSREKWLSYTTLFAKSIQKAKGVPFTKEAYGGVDLSILKSMCRNIQEETQLQEIADQKFFGHAERNYTYDPKTKKFYHIDIG